MEVVSRRTDLNRHDNNIYLKLIQISPSQIEDANWYIVAKRLPVDIFRDVIPEVSIRTASLSRRPTLSTSANTRTLSRPSSPRLSSITGVPEIAVGMALCLRRMPINLASTVSDRMSQACPCGSARVGCAWHILRVCCNLTPTTFFRSVLSLANAPRATNASSLIQTSHNHHRP